MEGIALTLLRTTVCTTFAAGVATLLLRACRVHSPAIHRVAWCLVLLQGWAFFPVVLSLPVANSSIVDTSAEGTLVAGQVWEPDGKVERTVSPAPLTTGSSFVLLSACATVFWVGGAAVAAFRLLRKYILLLYTLPYGRSPLNAQWNNEWEALIGETATRGKVQFRITDRTGPLLCFVPFFYLILAPQRLWSALEGNERVAILRHELAHLARGDLWKSATIRLLALPQWFNPLAWKAVRACDEAAEWACDEIAMGNHERNFQGSYPSTLLKVAEFTSLPPSGSVAARGGVLSSRIRRLVRSRFKEESKMTKFLLPMLLSGLVLIQSIRIEVVAADEEPAARAPVEVAESAAETRQAALARTGLVPYRVGAPDLIKITATGNPTAAGPSTSSSGVGGVYLVNPEGMVSLEFGDIPVAGKTVKEITRSCESEVGDRSWTAGSHGRSAA